MVKFFFEKSYPCEKLRTRGSKVHDAIITYNAIALIDCAARRRNKFLKSSFGKFGNLTLHSHSIKRDTREAIV